MPKWGAAVFFLFFFSSTVFSTPHVQNISSLHEEVVLDSKAHDNWFITFAESKNKKKIINDKGNFTWLKHPVPARVDDKKVADTFGLNFSRNTGDYLKAWLTLGQVGFKFHPDLWYKKQFKLPEKIETSLVLRLGVISDRDQAFLNGKELGSTGTFNSPEPQAYDKIRIYHIRPGLLQPGEDNTLLVRVQNYFPQTIGIVSGSTALGPSLTTLGNYWHSEYFHIILFITYLTAAGYFLFLFVRRRHDYEYLSFALMVLAIVAQQFLRTQFKYEFTDNLDLLKKFEYASLGAIIITMVNFTRIFFKVRYSALFKSIDSFYGLVTAWCLLHPSLRVNDFILTYAVQPTLFVPLGASLAIVVYRAWQRDAEALVMLGSALVVLGGMVLDFLSVNFIINLPLLSGYAFMFFIMSLAAILANRFVRINNENEALKESLEKRVIQRTKELQASLDHIKELKEQQDGDYFLTSLLIKPLSINRAQGENTRVEFLVNQKKKFQFRKWKSELGGDYCAAHSIKLRGRDYTVFLNGDAMGKSMQGAGGALVLAAVFNSILVQAEHSQHMKAKYPEQWLRDCFFDLQKIFINFEGSMAVSAVLGLVDEQSGFVLYINAEHPFTVLYRDQKASFIENEMQYRKIGIEQDELALYLQSFQMQKDDVLILGSDGRDDIVIDTDETGQRIVNHDENRFLTHVEKGQGKLDQVARAIENSGDLTDDLTMLRLHYLSTPASPVKEAGEVTAEIENDIEKGDFVEAAQKAEAASFTHAHVEEFLFLAQKAFKLQEKFHRAIDHGERLRLRNPTNKTNLKSLVEIYQKTGNQARSEKLQSLLG